MKALKRSMMTAVLVSLLALPTMARAAVPGYYDFLPAWMTVASSCAIDESSTAKYATSLATLSFKTGAVSSVDRLGFMLPLTARATVLSPLATGNPSWESMIVDYTDPDGQGTDYRVAVNLYALKRATGTTALVASFNSNNSSNTARAEGMVRFTHTFDFLNNEYFVELNLYRKDVNGNPQIRAVRLVHATEIPR